jgi:hypothetical protein
MDPLTFIANLIDSIAWPLALISILFIFRKSIIKILSSIKWFKYHDLEIRLEEEISELKETTKEYARIERDSKETEEAAIDEKIKEVAKVSPSASILLAWNEVEKEIKNVSSNSKLGKDIKNFKSPFSNIVMLFRNGYINETTFVLLNKLRSIRNQVAHTNVDLLNLDFDSAIDYGNMARIARRSIKNIIKTTHKNPI